MNNKINNKLKYYKYSKKYIYGWGRKKSGNRVLEESKKNNKPYILLEDGFIRSINPGDNENSFSLVLDEIGIYYDGKANSKLEKIINDLDFTYSKKNNNLEIKLNNKKLLDKEIKIEERFLPQNIQKTINYILKNKISKYNNSQNTTDYINPKTKQKNTFRNKTKRLLIKNKDIEKIKGHKQRLFNRKALKIRFEKEIEHIEKIKEINEEKINQILIIDQVEGDSSLEYGYGNTFTNKEMIEDIIRNNPCSKIFIKLHPDTLQGKNSNLKLKEIPKEIEIIEGNVNPIKLLEEMDIVYTKTSQMGFEALMVGCEVVCYGLPFYAGWGLTHDKILGEEYHFRRIRRNVSIEDIFVASYMCYPIYCNPYKKKKNKYIKEKSFPYISNENLKTKIREEIIDNELKIQIYKNEEIEIEEVIDTIIKYKPKLIKKENKLFLLGFSLWKRNYILSYLKQYQKNNIFFIEDYENTYQTLLDKKITIEDDIMIWSDKEKYKKELKDIEKINDKLVEKVISVEDGLVRSYNLGSDLTKPSSLVFDKKGIYFNPKTENDLEDLIEQRVKKRLNGIYNSSKEDEEKIRKFWLSKQITKYNKYKEEDILLSKESENILIVGQVSDDMSIKLGGYGFDNDKLIKAVRKDYPNANLIYKEHPDVVSGNRSGKISKESEKLINQYLKEGNIHSIVKKMDKVTTISSLVGFESLLINKKIEVVCYGLPFYAGWGLTTDKTLDEEVIKRRKNKPFFYLSNNGFFNDEKESLIGNYIKVEDIYNAFYIDYTTYIDKNNNFCELNVLLKEIYLEKNKYEKNKYLNIYNSIRNQFVRINFIIYKSIRKLLNWKI